MDAFTVLSIAGPTAFLTAGAAYGGIKVALNGTKDRVMKLEEELGTHKSETIDRLARIETKLDVFMEKY